MLDYVLLDDEIWLKFNYIHPSLHCTIYDGTNRHVLVPFPKEDEIIVEKDIFWVKIMVKDVPKCDLSKLRYSEKDCVYYTSK